jgi:uncharacterized protein (TIGR03067 family)
MRSIHSLLLAATLLASPTLTARAADDALFDPRLTGTWKSTGAGEPDRGDRLVIGKDGSMTFRGKDDSESYDGRIEKADAKSDPATLDVTITASSEREAVGKTVLAIYRIKGDRLEFAAHEPGQQQRPKSFDDEKARKLAFTRSEGSAETASEQKKAE